MNIVTDAVVEDPKADAEAEEIVLQEETVEAYSCNTCKVTFSSVMEHIQNYHNDQEVVVEVVVVNIFRKKIMLDIWCLIKIEKDETSTLEIFIRMC